jgi:hypothetical protein
MTKGRPPRGLTLSHPASILNLRKLFKEGRRVDNRQAVRLFQAYRAGLLRRSEPWERRSRPFDFLLKQVLSSKIRLAYRRTVYRVWRLSTEGVRLSRERKLEEAEARFTESWTALRTLEGSESARLIALTVLEAAHAYFEYKKGDFDGARARVFNSMEADLRLERDEDFALLEMHRVQSAQNLARIDLRMGQPERALRLAGQIIGYLEGLLAELPVHHSWEGSKRLSRMPLSLRHALVAQVTNEAVLAASAVRIDFRNVRNGFYEDYIARLQVVYPPLRLWLLANQALRGGDRGGYLRLMAEFLPTGRAQAQALWYSALLDLLALCRESDDPISRRLEQLILQDAKEWRDLPAAFRPRLGLDPEEPATCPAGPQAAGVQVLSH